MNCIMNLGSGIYFSLATELPGRLEKIHVLSFSLQTAQSQPPLTKRYDKSHHLSWWHWNLFFSWIHRILFLDFEAQEKIDEWYVVQRPIYGWGFTRTGSSSWVRCSLVFESFPRFPLWGWLKIHSFSCCMSSPCLFWRHWSALLWFLFFPGWPFLVWSVSPDQFLLRALPCRNTRVEALALCDLESLSVLRASPPGAGWLSGQPHQPRPPLTAWSARHLLVVCYLLFHPADMWNLTFKAYCPLFHKSFP